MAQPGQFEHQEIDELEVTVLMDDHWETVDEGSDPDAEVALLGVSVQEGLALEFVEVLLSLALLQLVSRQRHLRFF